MNSPFSTITISSNTEDDGTDRSKHEHEGNSPGDIDGSLLEGGSQWSDGQRHGEEVESIPSPCDETNEPVEPLFAVDHSQECNWVWCLGHGWLEGGDSGCCISTSRHVLLFWSSRWLIRAHRLLVVIHIDGRRRRMVMMGQRASGGDRCKVRIQPVL